MKWQIILFLFISQFLAVYTESQYTVIRRIKRSPIHFTQGLFFDTPDTLIESTGLHGESRIQRIDAQTGQPLLIRELSDKYFGEGCTMINGKIYQLTWQERDCFIYNKDLEHIETKEIMPEIQAGWGATTDSTNLYVSDGTSIIYVIDPKSWTITRRFHVITDQGKKLSSINELEYVDGYIYANVFLTNFIVKIDPKTGAIVKVYNMAKLHDENEAAYAGKPHDKGNDVLNGIAYNKKTGRFYVTGKRWNYIFEVTLE